MKLFQFYRDIKLVKYSPHLDAYDPQSTITEHHNANMRMLDRGIMNPLPQAA